MTDTEIVLAELVIKVDTLAAQVGTLGKRVSSHSGKIVKMSNKVFNGFGSKIDSVKDQVSQNKVDNNIHHANMEKVIGTMIKFGATSIVLIFIALLGILGSIWAADRRSTQQIKETYTHAEVKEDDVNDPTVPGTP